MLRESLKELEKNIEYFDYHNKNLTKEQDKKIMAIKCLLEELKNTHVWFEVARSEVETAIDDIYNDEYYSDEEKEKLDTLNTEDINRIAWKICDDVVWEDIYTSAREEIIEELELE